MITGVTLHLAVPTVRSNGKVCIDKYKLSTQNGYIAWTFRRDFECAPDLTNAKARGRDITENMKVSTFRVKMAPTGFTQRTIA